MPVAKEADATLLEKKLFPFCMSTIQHSLLTGSFNSFGKMNVEHHLQNPLFYVLPNHENSKFRLLLPLGHSIPK